MSVKSAKVTLEELESKYPTFMGEFLKMWRNIVRKALAEQARKNPQSKSLRGIKEVVRNHFPILLDDAELNKVVDMISTRFSVRKLCPDWDEWRDLLPNIFTEKVANGVAWFEDIEGIPSSVSVIKDTPVSTPGSAVIIIKDGNFKAEYSNVPSDIALSINADLSKALS